ncbi:MAG: HlyD family efflux transporter periplasmic adaptor subunit [Magnetococcales bacterium]|nr:HlyD family efflux transporter periplasmic adaptor subunit [Magnetococcales bacterium]
MGLSIAGGGISTWYGLREELTLHPGPATRSGSPTWTLHDPANNRFYRIGWPEFEMLNRWQLGDALAIAQAIDQETPLACDAALVEAFFEHLARHHLLRFSGDACVEGFASQLAKRRGHWLLGWLRRYFFWRIPLWRPDAFLEKHFFWLGWLFSGRFLLLSGILGLIGGGMVLQQWEAFTTTFVHLFSPVGLLYFGVALMLAKSVHELGHAVTAKRFGCRVTSLGVALLFMWPVLYCEVSEAWKLPSRRERLLVGLGGILAEIALASLALVSWHFVDDGPLRSALFLMATTTGLITVGVNLNPFMRFDGYYLLADLLEIPNLQEQAFAMGRWRLREVLLGLGEGAPIQTSRGRARFLVWFAWGVWLYRFFLFGAIALMVYHFFFKLLGVILLGVNVGWFLIRPVLGEFKQWFQRRDEMTLNRHSGLSVLILVAGLALFFIPWHTSLQLPALIRSKGEVTLYSQASGRVRAFPVTMGQEVHQGSLLLALDSPDLEHERHRAAREVSLLGWQQKAEGLEGQESGRVGVLARELAVAQTQLQGLEQEKAKLRLIAPWDGQVAWAQTKLAPGEWIAANEPLVTLVDPDHWLVEAWVAEGEMRRLSSVATGVFQPDMAELARIPCRMGPLERTHVSHLESPYQASIYGGAIPVRGDSRGEMMVDGGYVRFVCEPEPDFDVVGAYGLRVIRGTLTLKGEPISFAEESWRFLSAILIRESGF